MQVFEKHQGIAAPLLRANIDTDAIIPSREIRRVSREGLGQSLFAGWRYVDRGEPGEIPNAEFVLNRPDYAGASILLAGSNMGCGSSREFAVWALVDFGIRAIVAPSFGAIFYTNCVRNGLLPVVLSENVVNCLAEQVAVDPQHCKLTIDLASCVLSTPDGDAFEFELMSIYRQMLLQGLDAVDVTLRSKDEIARFLEKDRRHRSWAHLG